MEAQPGEYTVKQRLDSVSVSCFWKDSPHQPQLQFSCSPILRIWLLSRMCMKSFSYLMGGWWSVILLLIACFRGQNVMTRLVSLIPNIFNKHPWLFHLRIPDYIWFKCMTAKRQYKQAGVRFLFSLVYWYKYNYRKNAKATNYKSSAKELGKDDN